MSGSGALLFEQPSKDTLKVILSGSWKLGEPLPSTDDVHQQVESLGDVRQITFNAEKLEEWDTGLLTFLRKLWKFCSNSDIVVDSSGLPDGARQILELAAAVPEKKDARKAEGRVTFLTHLGDQTVEFFRSSGDLLEFIGEATVAFLRLLRGKAQYRRTDLWLIMEACSGQALPIVTLISFLVGMILAFIGVIQLALFGAEIYVANLVGIAMVRLMAAVMTGLLLAKHPWVPGGDIRSAWVPIFAPLALLAVLDALVVRFRRDAGYEISVIRAGAALFAAAAFVIDGSYSDSGSPSGK